MKLDNGVVAREGWQTLVPQRSSNFFEQLAMAPMMASMMASMRFRASLLDSALVCLLLIPSEPAELGSLLPASIVIETWSEPPRPGSIPSEPCLPASVVIDPCNSAGIFEIPSKPPGLGSSVSALNDNGGVIDLKPLGLGSCLSSSSIVIGLERERGVDETSSEPAKRGKRIDKTPSDPPGHSFHVSASIDDGVIEVDNDGRIDVLITEDLIRLFALDALDGENFVASMKKFKCLLSGTNSKKSTTMMELL